MSGTLVSAAKVLTDEISQSEFLPVDFEVSIGQKENSIAPVPIKLPFEKGVLKVVGTFDRADIYKKGNDTYVRIIDYKTGSKKFSKDDAQYGINLQMLLYLYSIIFSESKRYGKNVKPAGVLYLIVKRPAGKANLGDDIGKTLEKTEENSFCTNGIVLDNPEIIYAMEKEQSGKYIPVKQNAGGTYSKNSSIISSDEMMKLLNDAADASAKLMSELKGGHIEINPYKCDKINSCAYCDLNDFCRLEKKNEKTRYNLESLLSDTEEEK